MAGCIGYGLAHPESLELVVALTVVIVVNSAVSQWLSRRGTTWRSLGIEFIVMSVFNFGVLLAYIGLRSSFGSFRDCLDESLLGVLDEANVGCVELVHERPQSDAKLVAVCGLHTVEWVSLRSSSRVCELPGAPRRWMAQ